MGQTLFLLAKQSPCDDRRSQTGRLNILRFGYSTLPITKHVSDDKKGAQAPQTPAPLPLANAIQEVNQDRKRVPRWLSWTEKLHWM